MKPYKNYIHYTNFVLVFVFLVILAGGVVRMTQSGMGCPDWPKCFGLWIPPTCACQLPPDYEKYLRLQDIDHTFNPYHTWVEYINRLLGTLLGFIIIIHVVWSYRLFFKIKHSVFWWSASLLLLTGFQGWLGKRVVEANLAAVKITTHMIVALLIAAIPVLIVHKLRTEDKFYNKQLKWLSIAALAAIVLQIVFGTNVREQIDEISASLHYRQRDVWIGMLNNIFDVHRAFAGALALLCTALFLKSLGIAAVQKKATYIFVVMLATIALGFIMAYMQMPAIAQPLHLLASGALTILLFSYWLRVK